MTFLRWIGSKRKIVHKIADMFPDISKCRGYIEPFIGGGSVFYYLRQNYNLEGKPIYLSDINKELIIAYKVVRDKLNELIPLLEVHQKLNNKEYFDNMRKIFPPGEGMTDIEKAASFIYLSKCVFGSKWVVSSKGKLSTTYRGNEGENIFDDNIFLCSRLLQGTKINCYPFGRILQFKDIKDYFVYMDPPYYDVGVKDYAKDKFSRDTKEKIRSVFEELDKRGAKVMLSNSDGPTVRAYFKNYHINIIDTGRVADTFYTKYTKGEREKIDTDIKEVIVTNYKPIQKQKTIDDAWF